MSSLLALAPLAAALASVEPSAFPRFDELRPEDNVTAVPFTLVLLEPASAEGVFPSMHQSLHLYEAFAVGGNELVRRAFSSIDNDWLRLGLGLPTVALVNLATEAAFVLPFGAPHHGWLHEEWHRAVMTAHGIDTFDTLAVPDNQLGAALADRFYAGSSGSVIGATDEQLAAFKAASPGDYVRMSTAGIESQLVAIRDLERAQFFFGGEQAWWGPVVVARGWNAGTLIFNQLSTFGYLVECGTQGSVDFTGDMEEQEPGMVSARDFTGLDCDASVYDLFRPNEPYAARGPHPGGVGIDRYRTVADLDDDERRYAADTIARAALSFVDPALFNIGGLRLDDAVFGRRLKVTGRLAHLLSPIGSAVELEALAQVRPFNGAAVLRVTALPHGLVPSLDLDIVRVPFVWRLPGTTDPAVKSALAFVDPTVVTVSLGLQSWVQPHDLVATSDDLRVGGLVRAEIGVQPVPSIEVLASGMVKSEGFSPGVLSTGPVGGAGLAVRLWIY